MSNDLRDKGIAIANEAVEADNAQRYEEAVTKYVKAAEYLLTATKYEKNPVTLKTIREKCLECAHLSAIRTSTPCPPALKSYTLCADTTRAEALKKGMEKPSGRNQSGGGSKEDDKEDSSDEEIETEPLTNEQLEEAERDMEAELEKLVGMESVKMSMRKLCKQLSLDIRRRQEGHAVLDSIRHMIFTGNPGVGKTTISRLVAKLYKQLGVSSKDHVIEVGH